MRKLNLDRDRIDDCIKIAARIVSHAQKYIDRHSTRAVEIATLQCLGLTETWKDRLLADWVISKLTKDQLRCGAAFWWGTALVSEKGTPREIAEAIARGKLKWEKISRAPHHEIRNKLKGSAPAAWQKNFRRELRGPRPEFVLGQPLENYKKWLKKSRSHVAAVMVTWPTPKEALRESRIAEGKESVAVRVPLFQKEAPQKQWIPDALGLHTPDAVAQILSLPAPAVTIDAFANVAYYGLYPQKSFVDQYFSVRLASHFQMPVAAAGFLWLSSLGTSPSEIIAHLILQEQFFVSAGMDRRNISLSYFLDPASVQKGIPALAMTQMAREIFSQETLQLMARDIPSDFLLLLSVLTDQDQLLFSPSEESSMQQFAKGREIYQSLEDALEFNLYGPVAREAHAMLDAVWRHLKKIELQTFWKYFAKEGEWTKGREELFQVDRNYFNPVREKLCQESESF